MIIIFFLLDIPNLQGRFGTCYKWLDSNTKDEWLVYYYCISFGRDLW